MRPAIRTILDTILAVGLFSTMGIFLIALMGGWERVPKTIGIILFAVVGLLGLIAILAFFAGLEHISERSQSKLLRGSAKTVMGIFFIACAVLMGWLLWNYLTDWIWRFQPCDTPGCRYD